MDDIIIWSNTIKEHQCNIRSVMEALRKAELLCSPRKTSLFLTEVDFLGHHISVCSIEADARKFEKILSWKPQHPAKEVCAFLGLVDYISICLPKLAEHTAVLTPLMSKSCDSLFPIWMHQHEAAFLGIKDLVTGMDCLTMIDHENMGKNRSG